MSTVLPFWHVSLPATELGVGWFSLTTAAGSVTDGERERERLPASNPGLDAPVQILPFGSILDLFAKSNVCHPVSRSPERASLGASIASRGYACPTSLGQMHWRASPRKRCGSGLLAVTNVTTQHPLSFVVHVALCDPSLANQRPCRTSFRMCFRCTGKLSIDWAQRHLS